ncbi:MAG TPA: hypothetical protein VHW26_02970 [Solirubrobacteraceae bacterium]|jgi:hypothetical protein|nr:hypothetical protein [Solirubrobacteraceae bacterium]
MTSVVSLVGVCMIVAACGSSGPSTGPSTTAGTSTQSASAGQRKKSRKPRHRAARPVGPRVGATQRVKAQGTKLSITVSRVIDPLKDSGATLLPGTRAVGVFVRIVNDGPGGYDSSSTGDISIIPSSGVGSPAYAPKGACQTPLQDFDNAIGPGENRDGCVAFTLNTGAKLVGERFSADGGGAGIVKWRGPKK